MANGSKRGGSGNQGGGSRHNNSGNQGGGSRHNNSGNQGGRSHYNDSRRSHKANWNGGNDGSSLLSKRQASDQQHKEQFMNNYKRSIYIKQNTDHNGNVRHRPEPAQLQHDFSELIGFGMGMIGAMGAFQAVSLLKELSESDPGRFTFSFVKDAKQAIMWILTHGPCEEAFRANLESRALEKTKGEEASGYEGEREFQSRRGMQLVSDGASGGHGRGEPTAASRLGEDATDVVADVVVRAYKEANVSCDSRSGDRGDDFMGVD